MCGPDPFSRRRIRPWKRWAALTLFACTVALVTPAAGRADCVLPDLPDCACCLVAGQWPLTEVVGDVIATARNSVNAANSCLVHRGQPYWQIQLQVDSPVLGHFIAHWAPDLPVVFPAQAWCTETIAFWHRQAQVPDDEGYCALFWPSSYVQNVNELRAWYAVAEQLRDDWGWNTRGRWINGSRLDYGNFEPGVNGPCPGAYQALENYDYATGQWAQSNFHSQLVDSMVIYRLNDFTGPVQRVDVHVVDGNAGGGTFNDINGDVVSRGIVRDTKWYRDIIDFTSLCDDSTSCSTRKIRGWGIDFHADGSPYCDPARISTIVTHLIVAYPAPISEGYPDDGYVEALVNYSIATGGSIAVTANSPAIVTGNALPSRVNHWFIPTGLTVNPAYIQVDLRAQYPAPVNGVVVEWKDGYAPRNYQVAWAGPDFVFHSVATTSATTLLPPGGIPSMPLTTSFGPSPPQVRYLRVVLPLSALTRQYEITGFHLLFAYGQPDDEGNVYDDPDETTDVGESESPAPPLRLHPTWPNPFNPLTTLRFDLPVGGRVRLEVYDVAGRLVRSLLDADLPAGSHQAVWDGRDSTGRGMPSGSYFARLTAGGKVATARMGLVR